MFSYIDVLHFLLLMSDCVVLYWWVLNCSKNIDLYWSKQWYLAVVLNWNVIVNLKWDFVKKSFHFMRALNKHIFIICQLLSPNAYLMRTPPFSLGCPACSVCCAPSIPSCVHSLTIYASLSLMLTANGLFNHPTCRCL